MNNEPENMNASRFALLAALLVARTRMAEAKAYKGAEVYSLQSALHGRMEMRMRMIRGSGLLSTFFTYKTGSELSGATWEELDIEVLGKNDAKTWQSNIITGNPRMTSEQDAFVADVARRRLSHLHARMDAGLRLVVVRRRAHSEDRRWPGQQPDQPRELSLQRLVAAMSRAGPAPSTKRRFPRTSSSTGSSTTGTTTGSSCSTGPTISTRSIPPAGRLANWTFDGNRVDFDPANAVVQDGTLILAITKEERRDSAAPSPRTMVAAAPPRAAASPGRGRPTRRTACT